MLALVVEPGPGVAAQQTGLLVQAEDINDLGGFLLRPPLGRGVVGDDATGRLTPLQNDLVLLLGLDLLYVRRLLPRSQVCCHGVLPRVR